MDVREVLRSADGLTTLLVDVANDTNDDVRFQDLTNDNSGVLAPQLFDPATSTRHSPIQRPAPNTPHCLCTSDVTINSGEVVTIHATYADIDPDTEAVRVEIGDWAPVPDVPVRSVGAFAAGSATDVMVEYRDDLTVQVASVTRHGDRETVLAVRYTNRDSAEAVALGDFPDPARLGIVDTDSLTVFLPRVVAFSPMVVGDSDVRELALGESITFQVLMAPLPPTTETVLLRGVGLRRSFPVTVGDDDGPPAVAIADGTPPDDIDEPDIFALDVPTDRFTTAMVPTEAPDEPTVDELGPELPELAVVASVTSEPQPGWTVAVRGVVRGTGGHATLVMDLTRTDEAEDRWPESLADGANNLAGLRVIDPDARRSYGPLTGGSATVDSSDAVSFGEGTRTRTVFAALPDLGDAASVTVDLPGFGAVERVPVVDGPDAADSTVGATMRLEFDVSGRGADEPVAPNEINDNDNPDGRADNRRVTVTYTAG